MGTGIERTRELRRRRKRKQKLALWKKRYSNASSGEKDAIQNRLRRLTPGAKIVIENLENA